jgi:cytochrome c553
LGYNNKEEKVVVMRAQGLVLTFAAIATSFTFSPSYAQEALPAWAFPMNPPDFKPASDDGSVRRVSGSAAGYTLSQTRDRFAATDWHPGDHPTMPDVVAQGRKPDVFACGWCHRADGPGGPENANLMGLPYAYIVQQMKDYRSGDRKTSVPKRAPTALMIAGSKNVSDAEIDEAARYFSSIKPRTTLRVVETAVVPATTVHGWIHVENGAGRTEPIGQRIIEVPESPEAFESRDSRARFVVYAPPGSVSRGRVLVETGAGGRSLPCATCHGPELKGTDVVPPIVGRWPSYLARQIYDFRTGARAGVNAAQMKPVIEKLTDEDIVAITAYLASLAP